MVFGVHDFPSETSKSIFHLKRFTFYWLCQISQEKRELFKLDEEEKELVLLHNNFNEIDF
jgi:hypothetical protein